MTPSAAGDRQIFPRQTKIILVCIQPMYNRLNQRQHFTVAWAPEHITIYLRDCERQQMVAQGILHPWHSVGTLDVNIEIDALEKFVRQLPVSMFPAAAWPGGFHDRN
jgi:hypothetical protein